MLVFCDRALLIYAKRKKTIAMIDLSAFSEFSTCNYADFLKPTSFMDRGIRPLWSGGPRLVGRAFTVRCEAGDNLMMHAAIYEAPRGSVVVLDAGDDKFAVAGGNVCAVAKQRGIAGFIIDGVIRDIAEICEMKFPVYARGIVPKPGKKAKLGELGGPVTCGGISVRTGDVVVADEDGVVIVEHDKAASVFEQTRKKVEHERNQSLEEWQRHHYQKISGLISGLSN